MSKSLADIIDNSIRIAWDYLRRTGAIDDPAATSEFLDRTITDMAMRGERRCILLANKAITSYLHERSIAA